MSAAILVGCAVLAAPVGAAADDIVLERPASAQPANLATYGDTFAWSERAADGTYRLIVRTGDGAPAAAPARPFTTPVDLDAGPRAGGGAPVIVYARCAGTCDVYRFDPAAGRETKISAISRRERRRRRHRPGTARTSSPAPGAVPGARTCTGRGAERAG